MTASRPRTPELARRRGRRRRSTTTPGSWSPSSTAMADGVVSDRRGARRRRERVVALMNEIEPLLDDALHAKVTQLLCELTAFDLMQMLHALQRSAAADDVPRLTGRRVAPMDRIPRTSRRVHRGGGDPMAGKPKTSFYVVLAVVVVAPGRVRRLPGRHLRAPKGSRRRRRRPIDPTRIGAGGAEAADATGVTTVKEYSFVPAQKLPPVKGTSRLQAAARTTPSASPSTSGPAGRRSSSPTTASRPGKVWTTPGRRGPFKVELVLIDDPVAMRDAYAAGEVHIGWATLDMVPLFMEGFVDAAASQGQPRHAAHLPAGRLVQRRRRHRRPRRQGSERPSPTCAARRSCWPRTRPRSTSSSTCWSPAACSPPRSSSSTPRTPSRPPPPSTPTRRSPPASPGRRTSTTWQRCEGNRMLVTTATANKLIADVWFARADFASDHPDICEGLVRGIFDAHGGAEGPRPAKQKAAELMAERLQHPGQPRPSACSATPTRPTTPRTASSS